MVYANRLQTEAESLAQTGKSAIQLLARYNAGVQGSALDQIGACYDEDYTNQSDGLWVEQLRYESDGVQVYDWEVDRARPFGKADAVEQIAHYLGTVATLTESKFKLDLVEEMPNPQEAVIRSFLWLRGTRPSGTFFESQAMFRMWIHDAGDEWKIHRQELIDGHTVTGDRTGFTDITAAAGIDVVTRLNPVWFEDGWIPERFGIVKYATGGISTVDFDDDGWYDLFIINGPAFHLYRNKGDGTFADVTADVGLPTAMAGASTGLFADFDGDGDKDLFVSRMTQSGLLYRNDGDHTFTDVSEGAGLGHPFVAHVVAADYDNDGRLDLYLGRYLDPRRN
ncbi:MAG: VCBS repeat-containing protein, partial [Planctomycetaceae bacterium]